MSEQLSKHNVPNPRNIDQVLADHAVELAFDNNDLLDQIRTDGYASKKSKEARDKFIANNEVVGKLIGRGEATKSPEQQGDVQVNFNDRINIRLTPQAREIADKAGESSILKYGEREDGSTDLQFHQFLGLYGGMFKLHTSAIPEAIESNNFKIKR